MLAKDAVPGRGDCDGRGGTGDGVRCVICRREYHSKKELDQGSCAIVDHGEPGVADDVE